MKLLIVDDEIIAVRAMLEGVVWETCEMESDIQVAYDVTGAISILESQCIDIILCDIEMPGRSGLELLNYIKAKELDLIFVFLTCHASFTYAQQAIKLGCQDYLLKPVSCEKIAEVVSSAVQRLKSQRKQYEVIKYGQTWLNEKVGKMEQVQGHKMSSGEMVDYIADYILQHLDAENLTVTHLAQQLFIHEDHLNRIFKKKKGISVRQFVIRERMDLAVRLLTQSDISMNVIAEKVGYENYSYFSVAFKKVCGCTPTEYRQNNEKSQNENETSLF